MGQFGLPIWNVVTMFLSEGQGDLLQKGQGLVDILGLTFSVLGSLNLKEKKVTKMSKKHDFFMVTCMVTIANYYKVLH